MLGYHVLSAQDLYPLLDGTICARTDVIDFSIRLCDVLDEGERAVS